MCTYSIHTTQPNWMYTVPWALVMRQDTICESRHTYERAGYMAGRSHAALNEWWSLMLVCWRQEMIMQHEDGECRCDHTVHSWTGCMCYTCYGALHEARSVVCVTPHT